MATTTATILIGHAHQNDSGIIPSHLIRFTENDRPAFILHSLESIEENKVIIPTIENTIDDLYLMIAVFILNKMEPAIVLHSKERKSIYDIFDEKERTELYKKTKLIIEESNLKVVFNLLEDSLLLNQLHIIKQYPNDYEVTVPYMKNEYSAWSGKVTFKEFKK
jgi:hypothetical protein